MAFTLAFHIILVPLGVSWAFMTLVANHRAIKHDDADALALARRWSKFMAVTFAVGAVSGTVLSFELGLLWPRLMGRFGPAFGVPFAVEGLFFFLEAIFIAIYIYGWKRLSAWAHFWTGVPIVIAGIGGTTSVVAANSWMNEPSGFRLDRAGKVVAVHPWSVYFNKATPYESVHMLVAAYLVGGFLVASVYAFALLRGRRDRLHRLGFIIPFTVAAIAAPVQLVVGDTVARWVYRNEPVKFAAIEMVPRTSTDVPETLFGIFHRDGRVTGGIKLPGVASILSNPGRGTATRIRGLNIVPANQAPTAAQVTTVHLAWDVMVGIATLLTALAAWYAAAWILRRDLPKSRWFLRGASLAGIASVVALEAGWTVTEVGRQPWVVHNYLRVGRAATLNHGVWLTFLVVIALFVVLGVTTIWVLRRVGRSADGERDVPYAPNPPADTGAPLEVPRRA